MSKFHGKTWPPISENRTSLIILETRILKILKRRESVTLFLHTGQGIPRDFPEPGNVVRLHYITFPAL